jgi:hypothetical protein
MVNPVYKKISIVGEDSFALGEPLPTPREPLFIPHPLLLEPESGSEIVRRVSDN